MKFSVYRETDFSAAHHLRNYHGKCENIHGHNWRIRLYATRENLSDSGFVVDFKVLDSILMTVTSRLDHTDINTVPPFDTQNPTAEHIAQYIFTAAQTELTAIDPLVEVERVMVWESEKSCAIAQRG